MKSEYVIKIKLYNCQWDMEKLTKKISKIFDKYNKKLMETGWDSYCIKYNISHKDNTDKINKKNDKKINEILKEL